MQAALERPSILASSSMLMMQEALKAWEHVRKDKGGDWSGHAEPFILDRMLRAYGDVWVWRRETLRTAPLAMGSPDLLPWNRRIARAGEFAHGAVAWPNVDGCGTKGE